MARAIVTITDGDEEGMVDVQVELDPPLTKEQFDKSELTEAQAIALLILQDLATDELGKHSQDGDISEGVDVSG